MYINFFLLIGFKNDINSLKMVIMYMYIKILIYIIKKIYKFKVLK